MSKNFELLQNLAKERDLFDTGSGTGTGTGTNTGTAVISEARPVEVNPMGGSPLQLAADEGQRDELGKLVQRVFLQREPEAFRSVLFCGTEPGNGCSWTCARAAEILASQVRASVCVVDANLRAPSHSLPAIPSEASSARFVTILPYSAAGPIPPAAGLCSVPIVCARAWRN